MRTTDNKELGIMVDLFWFFNRIYDLKYVYLEFKDNEVILR